MKITIEIDDQEIRNQLLPLLNQLPAAAPKGEPVLVSISEAAKLLGLSRTTTYWLVARGDVPSVRFSPRVVRVSREALQQYISDQEATAAAKSTPSPWASTGPNRSPATSGKPLGPTDNKPRKAHCVTRDGLKGPREDLVSAKDLARTLSIDRVGAMQLLESKKFPVRMDGVRLVATRGDIADWIARDQHGWLKFINA